MLDDKPSEPTTEALDFALYKAEPLMNWLESFDITDDQREDLYRGITAAILAERQEARADLLKERDELRAENAQLRAHLGAHGCKFETTFPASPDPDPGYEEQEGG